MKKIIFSIFLITISTFAQENKTILTGNISNDLAVSSNNYKLDEGIQSLVLQKRSPMLAAAMSVVLPGAGQFYNEDYWKTAIFATLEVAAIVTAITYSHKGDDQTESFEAFANSPEGWDVQNYAKWSVKEAHRINNEIVEGDPVLDIFDNNGDVIWSKLNHLETKIGHWYSHQLATYNEQQYYEMIGKYQQFNPGWNDFYSDDYTYTDTYSYGDPLTPTFYWYADERGEANHFYNISNMAIKILVVNHIVSAVEAALSANSYDRSLNAEVKMESSSIGYNRIFYPELNFSYRF